jgi:hypothetical protein
MSAANCPRCNVEWTPDPPTFTPQQLADWRKYEQVRKSGRFNMLFPGARAATRLSESRYTFALENYVALRDAQPKLKTSAALRAQDAQGGAA